MGNWDVNGDKLSVLFNFNSDTRKENLIPILFSKLKKKKKKIPPGWVNGIGVGHFMNNYKLSLYSSPYP